MKNNISGSGGFFKRLADLTNNIPTKSKYILYFGTMMFFIVLLVSLVTLMFFSNEMEHKERETLSVQTEYAAQTVENEIGSYRRILNTLYIDGSLHSMILSGSDISSGGRSYESMLSYFYENIKNIKSYLASLLSSCEYRPELVLYISDAVAPYKYKFSDSLDYTSSVSNEEWFLNAENDPRTHMIWDVVPYAAEDGSDQFKLTCTLALRNIRFSSDPVRIAYVHLEKDIRWLDRPLGKQLDLKNGAVYILDKNDALVYSSSRDPDAGSDAANAVNTQRSLYGTVSGYAKLSGSSIAYFSRVKNMDWTLIYVTGSRLNSLGYQFQSAVLLLLIPVILLSILLLVISSNFMTRRLVSLTGSVRKISEDNLELDSEISGKDEVGVLSDAFRKTLDMVRDLLERNKTVERERYMTELQILQERTNPHFLYNTLSSINAMAMDIDAYSISEALSSLADFYRLSLSHGSEIITVREELQLLKKYIEICHLRFGDRVEVVIDVPERFLDNKTPKLVLQPFFENAILHGLRARSDVQDRITVSAESRDGNLIFRIRDNGAGIDSERLESIRKMSLDGEFHAISSTDRRIKLHYGPDYGVDIESEPGVGTEVCVRIPDSK